jgi:squalene-associated FAD-dependent desaturase
MTARRVAVVGAGWAGLAAAVRLAQAGHAVTLFEMAAEPGGRARAVVRDGQSLDNGQHILIGAYRRTLALMQTCGVDPSRVLHRMPLTLRYPDGRGLQMPPGPPLLAFARAVMSCEGWTWFDRLALLGAASAWALRGFQCHPSLSVGALTRNLPSRVRALLIDPLCVAALNTPAHEASAMVLLRVLRDALFSGRGSADLLLPSRPLSELLPEPARRWLSQAGVDLRWRRRVQALDLIQAKWQLDGEAFDRVVLACSAAEAARLSAPSAPAWSARAAALQYEPIVTVYLRCEGARLAAPMMALPEGPQAPAQFAFDHGALGGTPGLFALVVSGARPWVERGLDHTAAAAHMQVSELLPAATIQQVLAEKRATFRCTPGLDRPPAVVAPGLVAAGDYIEGPYPATLEGAVRAGEAAAALIGSARS